MHKEELVYLTCDIGHNFAVQLDEIAPGNMDDLTCPICSGYVATETNRTVLVATGYKDLIALDEFLEDYTGKAKGPDQGQLSSPEIAAMHQDGTLCQTCGTYLGEATGEPRACKGCKDGK